MLDLTLNMALGFDTKNLKIIFFGTPDFVIPVLSTLQKNFSLVGIVTAPDKKVGRKQLLTPSPLKSWLQGDALDVQPKPKEPKVFTPVSFDQKIIQSLKKLQPDLIIVAAYGKIIPQEIIDIPKFGSINIHPSLLPKYRGSSPIQSVILNGDKVSGISIIKMDKEIDHGPVIYAEEFSLSSIDTFETLSINMFLRSAGILLKIIPAYISGKLKPELQNHAIASYCNLMKKEDGYFSIDNLPKPEILNRMIRAYYPWPTAWTKWNPSQLHKDTPCEAKVIKFLPGNLVQIEGKKPILLKDFLNGYPNFPIKVLKS